LSNKGYTLIEIIMAVTILALITVSISTLLSQSVYSNTKSKEITIATALAQDKIEELKALSFGEVRVKIGEQNEECIDSNAIYFHRSVRIQTENINLLKITVEVQGDNGVVEIATYKGKF